MQALPSATEQPMPPRTKPTAYHRKGNDPQFDLRSELYRIAGVVDSPLFRKKRTATDPEFCEGFEILLVSAGDCVFLPAFNAKTILSRRVLLDL